MQIKFFSILIVMVVLSTSLFATELNWSHDYKKAFKLAKKEHKSVYLFVGADNCRFCDKFKATALQNRCVLTRLKQDYILLYMSRDQDKIPSQYETVGVPRHYFLDADEHVFYEALGGMDVQGFKLALDEAELSRD